MAGAARNLYPKLWRQAHSDESEATVTPETTELERLQVASRHSSTVPPARLADELDLSREEGDPLADALVRRLHERNELARADSYLENPALAESVGAQIPELLAYREATRGLPDFADEDLIAEGQAVFERYGPLVLTQLLFRSLPFCYAAYPGVKVVLAGGKLRSDLRRRTLETAQMVVNVLSDRQLGIDGVGLRTLRRVRLIHAQLRHRLGNGAGDDSDTDLPDVGVLINQEDLVGTMLAFSIVVLDGLKRMGISLDDREQSAYLHVWSVAGALLGIKEQLIPLDVRHARDLQDAIVARRHRESSEGKLLTREILQLGREIIPGRFLDGLPASTMRFLLGGPLAAKLGVPRYNFTYAVLWMLCLVSRVFDRAADYLPFLRGPIRRIGASVTVGLLRMQGASARSQLRISDHLQAQWNVAAQPKLSLWARLRRFAQGTVESGLSAGRPWMALGFGASIPYEWFSFTPRFTAEGDVIGPKFFERLAARFGGNVMQPFNPAGIVDDFGTLGDGRFEPRKVAPIIAEFYERTSAFAVKVKARPNPLLRGLLFLVVRPYAKRIRQLHLPYGERYVDIDSWIELIDLDHDRRADYRAWVRIVPGQTAAMQIGAYRHFRSTRGRSHIAAVLPLPSGNLTAVLTLRNFAGDGVELSTKDRTSDIAGLSIVYPGEEAFGRRPSVITSEIFRMRPLSDSRIEVRSMTRLLGIPVFWLDYLIERKGAGRVDGEQLARACESYARALGDTCVSMQSGVTQAGRERVH
jgi:hypothetical protein